MSSTFTEDNIDPALLAMDPAFAFLLNIKATSASGPSLSGQASASGSSSPSMDSPGSNEGDTMDQSPDTPVPSGSNATTPLVAFGHLVKRQTELTEQSTVAFDQFCALRTSDERQVMLFAHVLQMLEMARSNSRSSLLRKIHTYTQAFILSPTTTAYRGLNTAEHIVSAMRECGIKDLPPDEDTAANELVLTETCNKATYFRNILKTKLKASTAKKSDTRNIAELAAKLYQRLAFLRFCVVEYPALSEDEFWPKVDGIIDSYRKKCNQAELNMLFTSFYDKDKAIYGDPATTEHQTVDIQTLVSWQKTVLKHSEAVQPALKKRKISEVEDSDDEENGDGAGDQDN
ncbi:hypothetical protein C8J57DRAFT_1523393 [Mycena rebaudengoi]|nr:hypothetical protein C8J57DRAFT_1523393 [Mycena rebaudengoi]